MMMSPSPSRTPRSSLPTCLAATAIALSAAALSQGCAARPSASKDAPATQAAEAGDAAAPTAMPYPGVSSSDGDLASEEKAFGDAEKLLDLALASKGPAGEPLDTSADRCELVCKALSSMVRSAKQVCTLAPDRCEAASERVRGASERAKGACPACEAAAG
ncbi:MAG: hypothetical protein IPG04_21745 [Polyangiaceae bacterium]|nr:hypothetical protein [Polyangiaceae bacterium]